MIAETDAVQECGAFDALILFTAVQIMAKPQGIQTIVAQAASQTLVVVDLQCG